MNKVFMMLFPACENGFYGFNCSQQCSTTCKDQLCHKENGKCIQCASGYKGDYCTESKQRWNIFGKFNN